MVRGAAPIETFKIEVSTYHYISARIGLKPYQIEEKTGISAIESFALQKKRKFNRASLRKLNTLCLNRAGVSLPKLIVESEDAISLAELIPILGKPRLWIWKKVAQSGAKPITRKPYFYIDWRDIFSILGAKDIADHLKCHPLSIWRRERRLSIANAAERLGISPEELIKIEAGQLPDPPTTIINDIDFTAWYQIYRLL